MVICTIAAVFCLLEDQSCVQRKMNSTARVGPVGWHCCQRGKEVAGLCEKPHTILRREDDIFGQWTELILIQGHQEFTPETIEFPSSKNQTKYKSLI